MMKSRIKTFFYRTVCDLFKLAIAFLAALPLMYLVYVPVNIFYTDFLCERFPDSFRVYNKVIDYANYQLMTDRLSFASAIIALLVIAWLTAIYSIEKRDEIFAATQGFYLLKGGWELYLRSYFLTDLTSALIANSVFITAAYFIPNSILDFDLTVLTKIQDSLLAVISPVGSILLSVLLMTVIRIPAYLFAVRRWRGELLSHLVDI